MVKVKEFESGHLLTWKDQKLPDGLDENVLFQCWKGDDTWADVGQSVEWIPVGASLVYQARGIRTPNCTLMELFTPKSHQLASKKRTRSLSPEVVIIAESLQVSGSSSQSAKKGSGHHH